jgi:hypothetical protein
VCRAFRLAEVEAITVEHVVLIDGPVERKAATVAARS